ncbi:hypothetical protein FRC16_009948, partial [Serendipita sp. 398]
MLRVSTNQCLKQAFRRQYSTLKMVPGAVVVPSISTPFPFTWLRDSCQCPSCIHPSTRQKLRESSSVPLNVQPSNEPGAVTISNDSKLVVQWDPRSEPDKQPHTSSYSFDFLKRYSNAEDLHSFHRDVDTVKWNAAEVSSSSALYVSYQDLQTPSGLLKSITQLAQYGLLFVTQVPSEKTSDQDCELQNLATIFGEIRETFYGRVWDVKNIKNSKNIAYTNLNLDLHMDLLYFQHPPRYQILHCLRNRVKGGTSVFVDAFKAAEQLHSSSSEAFECLSNTPVDFHYINDGHHLHHSHPTIQLTPSYKHTLGSTTNSVPEISHVNYSPPFQAPLPITTPPAFYPSLAKFAEILRRPENRFEYLLKEGDAVLFDNRRV